MPRKKIKNFEDAFEVLDQAAEPRTLNIHNLIRGATNHMQSSLKNKMNNVQEQLTQTANDAKDKVVDFAKHSAKNVDAHAHKKPWYYVGFAAAFSAIAGFFFGRKTK